MAVPVEEPVGRASELARMRAALAGLGRREVTCLAVEGEAGIGKTHLLSHFRREAEARDCLVLGGSASEFEQDMPYGVWIEALDAYVAATDLQVDPETRLVLGDILTGLAEGDALRDGAAAHDRHRIHRGFRLLLDRVADDQPVILVLDDLHWSDDASAELAAALVRRPPGGDVLLAFGYRSGKAPLKLAAALASPGARVIELDPLTRSEGAALLGSDVRSQEILEQSGGNPFYILQLARAGTVRGDAAVGDRSGLDAGVPRLVVAAILDELRSLSPSARVLLESASVAGDPFELDLARAVSQLDEDQVLDDLDELLEHRLLNATVTPRRFSFRHPLTRRAVYESTGAGWRIGAHARAARALAATAPIAAAHHVERSAATGDADAVALLLAAGERSAARDPAGATRWLAAALRLTPEQDAPTRLRIIIELAQALGATGRLEESAARLLEALELAPRDDAGLRLRLSGAYARCQNFRGLHDLAHDRLVAALDELASPGSADATRGLIDRTICAFFTLDDDLMCELARQAVDSARALGDEPLLFAATCALAHVTSMRGFTSESGPAIVAAAQLADSQPDTAVPVHLEALNWLTYAEMMTGRYPDALRHGDRGIRIARHTGGTAFAPLTLTAQAMCLTMTGELADAAGHLDEALEIAEVSGNDYVLTSVIGNGALINLLAGDMDRALALSERGMQLVADVRGSRMAMMVRLGHAAVRRVGGATAAQTAHLVEEVGGWSLSILNPITRVAVLERVVRAELEADRVDDARAAAGSVPPEPLPIVHAIAEISRARVLLEDGEAEQAAAVGLDAAALAARAGAPLSAGRARVVAARALLARDRDRAVKMLREAEADFDARGALFDRAEVRRELRRIGVRVEPRKRAPDAGDGLEGLSQREREIAEHVTARQTNREIASELFLSEKTIETHLRNIFAKLGANSRVEVARAVEADREQRGP